MKVSTSASVIAACLRIVQFGSAAILIGILARFIWILNSYGAHKETRLIYAISIACISIVLALILIVPAKYSFYAFALDFAMFIMWIVCFALLEALTGTNTCQAGWYSNYWGFYWSRSGLWWSSACSRWRAVLAFSFIIAMAWLFSAMLGSYVCIRYYNMGRRTTPKTEKTAPKIVHQSPPAQQDVENFPRENYPRENNPR